MGNVQDIIGRCADAEIVASTPSYWSGPHKLWATIYLDEGKYLLVIRNAITRKVKAATEHLSLEDAKQWAEIYYAALWSIWK